MSGLYNPSRGNILVLSELHRDPGNDPDKTRRGGNGDGHANVNTVIDPGRQAGKREGATTVHVYD